MSLVFVLLAYPVFILSFLILTSEDSLNMMRNWKINLDQFDISLKDKSKAGKILKKLVQNQHIALLKCHICNEKQSIECHIIKKIV